MDFSLRISCSLGDARKTQYRRVDRQVSHGFEAARLRCGEWLLQASKRRSITVTRNRKFHEIHQWNSLKFTSLSSYCSPLVSGVSGLRESWLILSISFTRANWLVMMAMMIIIYYYRVCVLPIVSFFWNIPKGVWWIYEYMVFIGFLRLELSRSIQPHCFMFSWSAKAPF